MSEKKYAVEVNDLVVEFKTDEGIVHALNGMDLKVENGKTLGLVGETGAGKTTTALSILRLIPSPPGKIVGGQIKLAGEDLFSKTEEEMRKIRGKAVDIPPKELELLYFLASNCNRVFTRDQLLDKVWGFDYLGDSRTVDVHVKRLREKLEGVSDKWTLKTVWGVGYKFEVNS